MATTHHLSVLLNELAEIPAAIDCVVTGLSLDSRLVKAGDLFFAYQGTHYNGRDYIEQAIAKGARVVLVEDEKAGVQWHGTVPIIPVAFLHKNIGLIAARYFGFPARSLHVIGVTGTNGKTSCSHFIAAALQELNIPCGVVGTLGSGIYGDIKAGSLTTPDAITLQHTLANFLEQHIKIISMEVSSHSLDQYRVNSIDFNIGIFTNLTRDHLDYHLTMEAYGAAKKKLFDQAKFSVINIDDMFGKKIIGFLRNKIITYGTDKTADVFADQIQLDATGIHAKVHTPWGEGDLRASLVGEFNLSNLLAVLSALCLLDMPFTSVLTALSHLTPVAGRMQLLGGKNKPLVAVDYAHTPDALEKALIALRKHTQGKLYCVFGCGGDRDRGKRPLMAAIAEKYADQVIVTDDNPRTEEPAKIVADILQGFSNISCIEVQHDRSQAIQNAIQYAAIGDCILVAGKGAELYQQIGEEKIPFSDVEKVSAGLANIGEKNVSVVK